jgi:hypothetical protein
MGKREVFWGVISCVVILLAYIVPYTLLANVANWFGSFLLWSGVAFVIIIINLIITKDWGS